MSSEFSNSHDLSRSAGEVNSQPLAALQGQYLAAISARQPAARKDSEREPVCPAANGKDSKLGGAMSAGVSGFIGEPPDSSPGSQNGKRGYGDGSNESKLMSSSAAAAGFFAGGRSIFKPDSNVLRNGDGTVSSINFKDGLVGSFEYFPDKSLRSVKLSDGRVYTRADAKSQWLDQNSVPADMTKIEVDGFGLLRLTDRTAVVTHMSSNESVRKEFPNFHADNLAGLYLKNEARLDLDKNGSIDRKELAKGIVSTEFKGEDAQFVAALQLRYADLKKQRSGFFGWDDPGITLTDLQDFSARARSEKALSDSAKSYEDVVTSKLLSEPGKSVTEDDVRAAVAASTDAGERDRLARFLSDFDKFTVSDWNPLAKKRVDLSSFQSGLKTLADAPAYAAARVMDGWVNSGSDSLEKMTDSVFADGGTEAGSVRAAAVRQGSVGNCYFMAGLASLAEVSPQTIKNMITPNADGTFTVRFPAIPEEPFVVAKPTEAERMLYSRSDQSGIWPQLIEKAYGAYRIKHGLVKLDARDRETGIAQEGSDGGDTIANGLSLLATGEVAVVEFAGKSEQEIGASISASLKAGKPVSLGLHKDEAETQRAGSPLEGLSNNHAYSVIGYDEKTGKVLVRNPWGSGEPSKNGIARDCDNDGVFALNVGELKDYFYTIAYFKN